MSRRHKENDIDIYKPQQAESHTDGSLRVHSNCDSAFNKLLSGLSITRRCPASVTFFADQIAEAIEKAFSQREIEVDDKWVKIPRRYFIDSLSTIRLEEKQETYAEEKRDRGRPWLKRLIDKVEDCQVVSWFKTTLHEAKQKCKELYQDITQLAVCFLKGIYEVMVPDEDPYGKVSHYHRILAGEIPNIPSRETLSRHYRWFVNWRKAVTHEDGKAKNERHKHRIWERLVNWIKEFLLKLAPQYAAQPIYGVGI
jgi:hypothetical protein